MRRYGRISISVSCVTVVAQGEKLIWLERAVVDRLRSLRGPGKSFSDVILRLAAEGENCRDRGRDLGGRHERDEGDGCGGWSVAYELVRRARR